MPSNKERGLRVVYISQIVMLAHYALIQRVTSGQSKMSAIGWEYSEKVRAESLWKICP
jgi:hypothetical protein